MIRLVEAICKKINPAIQIVNTLIKIKCESLVHSIEQTKRFCS